jgi:hypothetical protein
MGAVRRYQWQEKNAYITKGLSRKRPNVNPIVFYYTQIIYININKYIYTHTYIYIYIYIYIWDV